MSTRKSQNIFIFTSYSELIDCIHYLYLIIIQLFSGIGFCMVYMPAVLTVGFYFERWRALATGLALCGSGVGTFAFAPLTAELIRALGWRMTVVIHGGKISYINKQTYILYFKN